MMRGAAVPAGKHTLVYTYEPESFRIGAIVSLGGANCASHLRRGDSPQRLKAVIIAELKNHAFLGSAVHRAAAYGATKASMSSMSAFCGGVIGRRKAARAASRAARALPRSV